ncbi:MAG: hypothetical protein IJQ02_06220 [Oscillospiraceae bacterium]|nr:hypothetical protein [Oscillospiraceae bacterium]
MAKTRRSGASAAGTALYIVILVLLIVVMAAGGLYILKQVWTYASVYDETQAEPVIEAYVSHLRETVWDDSIAETVKAMPHQMQTDEEVGTLVKEMLLNDELTYELKPGATRTDSMTYNLLCGGNVFGEVTLVQDTSRNLVEDVNLPEQVVGVLAKIGVAIQPELYSWKVGEERFDFTGLYSSITVTVPESYRVTLNGVTLSDEYITERDIHYDVLDSYYYMYEDLPCKVTYQFDNIMGHLEPVIYDENDNVFVIDETKDDSQFLQPVDTPTLERIEAFIDVFSDKYLQMSANTLDPNMAFNELLPYLEQGSEFEKRMRQAATTDSWSHNSYYQYNGSEVLSAVKLGENFYVVEFNASGQANQPAGVNEITRNLRAIVDGSGEQMVAVTIEDI